MVVISTSASACLCVRRFYCDAGLKEGTRAFGETAPAAEVDQWDKRTPWAPIFHDLQIGQNVAITRTELFFPLSKKIQQRFFPNFVLAKFGNIQKILSIPFMVWRILANFLLYFFWAFFFKKNRELVVEYFLKI